MYMDYTTDHVKEGEPATNKKQATLPKKIWKGLGNRPRITLIQCGDLDCDQNDTVRQIRQNHNMGTDYLNTNQITLAGPSE